MTIIREKKIREQWENLEKNYGRYMDRYEKLISEVKESIKREEKETPVAFRKLLNEMANDPLLLKGCIPLFEAFRGIKGEIGNGRRISRSKASEELYREIYGNEITKDLSVSEFCREKGITRSKYYRIKKCDVKNEADRHYLEMLKEKART